MRTLTKSISQAKIHSSEKIRGRLIYRFLTLNKELKNTIDCSRDLIISYRGLELCVDCSKLSQKLFQNYNQIWHSLFEEWSDNQRSLVDLDLSLLDRQNKIIIEKITPIEGEINATNDK